ncbi:hypothetical protein HC023_00355 [Streptomyces sp. NEAU-H3]|nr:hypothetical protein [Streptomyces sp. NEAU-H3]
MAPGAEVSAAASTAAGETSGLGVTASGQYGGGRRRIDRRAREGAYAREAVSGGAHPRAPAGGAASTAGRAWVRTPLRP